MSATFSAHRPNDEGTKVNENIRWLVGGLVGILGVILGALVSVQGGVDHAQNLSIAEANENSRIATKRNTDVLERITIQQTETAAQLRAVAQTLKEIDERGTKASLRDNN